MGEIVHVNDKEQLNFIFTNTLSTLMCKVSVILRTKLFCRDNWTNCLLWGKDPKLLIWYSELEFCQRATYVRAHGCRALTEKMIVIVTKWKGANQQQKSYWAIFGLFQNYLLIISVSNIISLWGLDIILGLNC